jgi:hypothetical protein
MSRRKKQKQRTPSSELLLHRLEGETAEAWLERLRRHNEKTGAELREQIAALPDYSDLSDPKTLRIMGNAQRRRKQARLKAMKP